MTKRKPLKMGTCHACNKVDGWGLTMLDKDGNIRTICKTCHGKNCESCEFIFTHDNPAVEQLIYDCDGEPAEAQLWCSRCHEESKL